MSKFNCINCSIFWQNNCSNCVTCVGGSNYKELPPKGKKPMTVKEDK